MLEPKMILKCKNVLHGLAIGDALSWNALFHRSYLYPGWTRRIRREIDQESEQTNIIKTSLPFSLNQQSQNFKMCPTDDTEWVTFNLQLIKNNKGNYIYENHLDSWKKLSEIKDQIRGSVSVIAALDNISKGKYPPLSGKDNPHYFDDASMSRTIPILLSKLDDLDSALKNIELDSQITNSHEGVECALLYNRLLYYCLYDDNITNIIETVVQYIDKKLWINNVVTEALSISQNSSSVFDLVLKLNDEIVDNSYNYGSCAPINLAVILSMLYKYNNNFNEILFAANSITKVSDSVTPLLGAILGSLTEESVLTRDWENTIKFLKGICLPQLANVDYLGLVDTFFNNNLTESLGD